MHVHLQAHELNIVGSACRLPSMTEFKFTLSSDQLELLLAFERSQGLGHLAELMGRDPSVVSRNLQRIAQSQPVLTKVKGRWEITPLGMQVNQATRSFLEAQAKLFQQRTETRKSGAKDLFEHATLLIINAQKGLLDASRQGRNNSEAEGNVARILNHWRVKGRPIIHIKHVSDDPCSAFFRSSPGCQFLADMGPSQSELVIEKTKASAFAGTNLASLLDGPCDHLVLVGFTANECIDATARDACAQGFQNFVVSDATATFDLRDPSGKLIRADRIHRLTLLNMSAFHANVVCTDDALAE